MGGGSERGADYCEERLSEEGECGRMGNQGLGVGVGFDYWAGLGWGRVVCAGGFPACF